MYSKICGVMNIDFILNKLSEMVLNYGSKLLYAILVFFIGLWIIKLIKKALIKVIRIKLNDETLQSFLSSFISMLLKIILIITVISMLGIEMTSFVALLGAAGLAIGMAFSGTLQNFAGGIMILIFKPYKVGDTIEAQGYIGTVSEILIFNTILKTPDNKVIIIPNGPLATGSLINYSAQDKRRVDWTFGVAYGSDIDEVRSIIRKTLDDDNRIFKDPEYVIAVSLLADSSVNFTVRAWVETKEYWNVFFAINEAIYKEFNRNKISIPFPQMDVHISK